MGREPAVNIPAVILLLIASFILIEVSFIYFGEDLATDLYLKFGFIPSEVADRFGSDLYHALGEAASQTPQDQEGLGRAALADYLHDHPSAFPFSLVTYSFIHAGWPHLIINSVWLTAFGSVVARRIGPVRFLLLFMLSAIGAALFHFAIHYDDVMPVIGASGGVSGVMAGAIRFVFQPGETLSGFSLDRGGNYRAPALPLALTFRDRRTLRFILLWLAITIATGLVGIPLGFSDGSIAWEAHLGGFFTGLFVFSLVDVPVDDDHMIAAA